MRSATTGNGGTGVRANRTAAINHSTVSSNTAEGVDSDQTATATSASLVTANGLDGIQGPA